MIVFYDAPCPLCQRAVLFLLRIDRKKSLQFAPLQGETARKQGISPDINSLVLIQPDGTRLYRGKAVLRILWHLGGIYALPGLLSFLPGWLVNPPYRLIAHFRYRLFKSGRLQPEDYPGRFLP